jgi:ABC-2 type transport system ATP-binding protein
MRGIDLAVHPHELVGLVGPDGAGKTTLIRSMVGLISVDAGMTLVGGVDWSSAPQDARESMGYMPQHYGLYTDLSVDENLRFFGNLFDLSRSVFQERRDRLLAITRLHHAVDRPAGALSGGMYKKLAIACALLHRPRVLVLDEPTNGVDPVSRRELWALLHDFVVDGMGVLVSTPYMDEAARCDRVALIHDGALLVEGTPETLLDGFRHAVLAVSTPSRNLVDDRLDAHPAVLAITPAGERIRAVVLPEAVEEISQLLQEVGASASPAQPDFEDLYLSLITSNPAESEA